MEGSAMDDSKEEYDEQRSLVQTATDTLLFPLRVATSPPLLRTYLRTFLLLVTSTILFAFAVIAYTSFYYSYIPIRGISVPVYLQFDHGTAPGSLVPNAERRFGQESQKWPYAIAPVRGLVARQKYDVSVEMSVPRSRTNLKAGNWMLDLSLRTPSASSNADKLKNALGWEDDNASSADAGTATQVLAHSRRPAILTYRSWPTEYLYRFLRLPLYLTGFGTESETIQISMLEASYFPSAVPSSLRLELRSTTPLEIYTAKVHISAKLEGLRWLMYTHRLASAIAFVLLFWATEMGVLLLTWGAAQFLFSSSNSTSTPDDPDTNTEPHTPRIKNEDKLSDTEHTFPTFSSHPPLRYSSPESKKENGDQMPRLEDIPLKEDAEADDEDDDFVLEDHVSRPLEQGFTDSGLGTGVESERARVRRRGSARGARGEGGKS